MKLYACVCGLLCPLVVTLGTLQGVFNRCCVLAVSVQTRCNVITGYGNVRFISAPEFMSTLELAIIWEQYGATFISVSGLKASVIGVRTCPGWLNQVQSRVDGHIHLMMPSTAASDLSLPVSLTLFYTWGQHYVWCICNRCLRCSVAATN